MTDLFSEIAVADSPAGPDDQSSSSNTSHQGKHQTKNGKLGHIQSSKYQTDLDSKLETVKGCVRNVGKANKLALECDNSNENENANQTRLSSEEMDGFIPLS